MSTSHSQSSFKEIPSMQRAYSAGVDDLMDSNVESDVLYPHYGSQAGKTAFTKSPTIDAFAKMKRKMSNGSRLSRQRRLSGDHNCDTFLPETVRYHIYSSEKNGETVRQQQLLSTDGQHGLETILKTTGWWIDGQSPTDEEMQVLAKLFRIHPLTVEAILAREPMEKIELFPNYTFVSVRSFGTEDPIRPYNFYNLIFKDGLLTFYFQPSPHPSRVRHRLDQIKHHMLIGPDWIHYCLMDAIVDAFCPMVHQIEMESLAIDELSLVLHNSERSDMLQRISGCRKHASQISRLLVTKVEVMNSLMKRYEEKWQRAGGYALKTLNEVLLHLSDIQDHLTTMTQNMNHYNRILSRAHTNYLAQVNVGLSMTYRTTNKVMNRLSFLGTICIPITFIASLWGMNVKVPGKGILSTSWFYWVLVGMFSYCMILIFLGKKWRVL
ncbi:hypothetical protein BCR42DRAFT_457281 [Absidia repens]|uniref:Cora-domain-containing protein n=1 Tax=Absidia repens TaxID=90262 RepID=A0A1X2HWQ5_9FUNG|nr:hypothetical protein BCR42DRAFT_457281 [Absidia repens]